MSEIYTKNYDYNSYGVKLRDENENLLAELTINDRTEEEGNNFDALTRALIELIDKNTDELLQLYRNELEDINQSVDNSIVNFIEDFRKTPQIVEIRMHEKQDAIEYNEVLNREPTTFSFYCGRNFGYLLKIYTYKG